MMDADPIYIRVETPRGGTPRDGTLREGIPLKVKRDTSYYIDDGNITILVESTLFKVLTEYSSNRFSD